MNGFAPGQGLRVLNLSAHGDAFHGPKGQEIIAQAKAWVTR
jgi:hypothetical protein